MSGWFLPKRKWVVVICLWCGLSTVSGAQYTPGSGYTLGPLSFTGSAGFVSEAYAVKGINNRREPASGRFFATATASAFGISYGLNLDLSTEGSEFRQSLNRFGLDASYKWIKAAAGDVQPSFSPYSVSGINVRGALIELTPGRFMFSAAAGRTQRAVTPDAERPFLRPSYEQWLYSGKFGYEFSGGSSIGFTGMYANDDPSSLGAGNDLSPRENANLSTTVELHALDGRITFEGTGTLSAFNEDTRLIGTQTGSMPVMLRPFIDERAGVSSDYAGQFDIAYRGEAFSIRTGYERIQPGFRSLGLPYIRSDRESISFAPQVQLWDRKIRITLDYSRSRNNLLDNLTSTTLRNRYGLNTLIRLEGGVVINTSYRLMVNQTDPHDPLLAADVRQISHSFMLAPTKSWTDGSTSHNASLSTSVQLFDMQRQFRQNTSGSSFSNVTATGLYTLTMASGLLLNPSVSWLRSNSMNTTTSSVSVTMGAGYPLFDGKLNLGANTRFTHNNSRAGMGDFTTRQLQLNINAGYRLPFGDTLRLNIRGLSNNGRGTQFSEIQATLQLTHRF